jgi:hypothetical protein
MRAFSVWGAIELLLFNNKPIIDNSLFLAGTDEELIERYLSHYCIVMK